MGRWWGLDPEGKSYESGYIAFANSPIFIIDPNGEDSLIIHRSSPRYDHTFKVNYYDITVSVIRKGRETILPVEYQQVTNANYNYVQQPSNSYVKLYFQQMGSHEGEEGFKNTIFVDSGKRKPDGSVYATFMHPAWYPATSLSGCMVTCKKFLVEVGGAPDDGTGIYYGNRYYEYDARDISAESLAKFRELYRTYNIGDESGNLEGNDFLMKTDSKVEYIPKPDYKINPINTYIKFPGSQINIDIDNNLPERINSGGIRRNN
ncbi:MAG: hypothetical protein R3D00_21935 [Bacteroidia bacterium]